MISNLLLGIAGLVLAGDSFGRGAINRDIKLLLFGMVEFCAGIYFLIAAIRAANGA